MLPLLLLATLSPAAAPSVQDVPLFSQSGKQVGVLVFLRLECPLARLYTNRLNELQREWQARVHFVGIVCGQGDSQAALDAFGKQHALGFPLVNDAGARLAGRLGARRTPEAFLLDEHGIRYQGRIDDQYAPGARRAQATQHYLGAAIAAVLAGQPVPIPRTEPVGCFLEKPIPEIRDGPPAGTAATLPTLPAADESVSGGILLALCGAGVGSIGLWAWRRRLRANRRPCAE